MKSQIWMQRFLFEVAGINQSGSEAVSCLLWWAQVHLTSFSTEVSDSSAATNICPAAERTQDPVQARAREITLKKDAFDTSVNVADDKNIIACRQINVRPFDSRFQ